MELCHLSLPLDIVPFCVPKASSSSPRTQLSPMSFSTSLTYWLILIPCSEFLLLILVLELSSFLKPRITTSLGVLSLLSHLLSVYFLSCKCPIHNIVKHSRLLTSKYDCLVFWIQASDKLFNFHGLSIYQVGSILRQL